MPARETTRMMANKQSPRKLQAFGEVQTRVWLPGQHTGLVVSFVHIVRFSLRTGYLADFQAAGPRVAVLGRASQVGANAAGPSRSRADLLG